MDIDHINRFIQDRLVLEERTSVSAVEAAQWLDAGGLLKDSDTRKGKSYARLTASGACMEFVARY